MLCMDSSLVAASGAYASVVVHGLLITAASLVEEHKPLGMLASIVGAHRLSCPALLWNLIFLVQGRNPCLLCWQMDSLTTGPSGKSSNFFSLLSPLPLSQALSVFLHGPSLLKKELVESHLYSLHFVYSFSYLLKIS